MATTVAGEEGRSGREAEVGAAARGTSPHERGARPYPGAAEGGVGTGGAAAGGDGGRGGGSLRPSRGSASPR